MPGNKNPNSLHVDELGVRRTLRRLRGEGRVPSSLDEDVALVLNTRTPREEAALKGHIRRPERKSVKSPRQIMKGNTPA